MALRYAWMPALLMASLPANSTADTIQDYQTWTKILVTGSLGALSPSLEKFRYWFDAQARFANEKPALTQLLVRPGLGYAINEHASAWLGYAYFPTDPDTYKAINEQRVWEQFLWTQKFGPGRFNWYNRLEQRFHPRGSEVGWRFRQMYGWSFPLRFAPGFSLNLSDEVFINLNTTEWVQAGFNQNRAFAGIAYHFDPRSSAEVGYALRYLRDPGANNRLDNILSLGLSFHF